MKQRGHAALALTLTLVGSASMAGGCLDTQLIPADTSAGASEPMGGAGAGTTAGASNSGGKPAASAGGAAGGDGDVQGAGQAAAGRAEAGHAGSDPAGGVTWLTLIGSQAPATEPTNAALGIDGAVYAYADGCATLDYDPITRCASGHLCTAGANYENWGIALGFDFHTTGPEGSPRDSKLVWNPDEVGVLGVTWRVRGAAPGLQLWVLNMAPSFGGRCAQQACEILGPPDGAAAPALQGSLLFDQMVKDYWGGQGELYTYDPAAVFALQFKLPAINVGSANFDFCLDALGVIR